MLHRRFTSWLISVLADLCFFARNSHPAGAVSRQDAKIRKAAGAFIRGVDGLPSCNVNCTQAAAALISYIVNRRAPAPDFRSHFVSLRCFMESLFSRIVGLQWRVVSLFCRIAGLQWSVERFPRYIESLQCYITRLSCRITSLQCSTEGLFCRIAGLHCRFESLLCYEARLQRLIVNLYYCVVRFHPRSESPPYYTANLRCQLVRPLHSL